METPEAEGSAAAADENTIAGELPPGMSEEAFRRAVSLSGYPLQIRVGRALHDQGFRLEEEWAYLDPEDENRRALDVVGHRPLASEPIETAAGSSGFLAAVMVECKQSRHPLVFFESVNPPSLEAFPRVVGLRDGTVAIMPDDPEQNWARAVPLMLFLGADTQPFVTEPPVVASMSRATASGPKVELSGDEMYRSLTLPLTKGMSRYAQYWAGNSNRTAGDFRLLRMVSGIVVADAPMVLVRGPSVDPEMQPTSWVRLVVRDPVPAKRDVWRPLGFQVVDVVHWRFFQQYVDDKLLPFGAEILHRLRVVHDAVLENHARIRGLTQASEMPAPLYEHVR